MIPPIREAMKNLGTSGSPIVDFLKQYDRTKTPTLTADGVQYLNRDGSIRLKTGGDGRTAQVASWDLLYHILRANFDGRLEGSYVQAAENMDGDGMARYLSGVRVTDLKDIGELVKVEFEGVDGKETLVADIVIGADGPSSTVRRLLLPEAERTYAGYVTWRGTVKESLLSEGVRNLLGTKVRSSLCLSLQKLILHSLVSPLPRGHR
jgi:2-polyprenyl-6-methoxyphenol hydroxylase-like FAD-dependent oxidoreductase